MCSRMEDLNQTRIASHDHGPPKEALLDWTPMTPDTAHGTVIIVWGIDLIIPACALEGTPIRNA